MSENDRFDWSDDADFDSLAGEPIEGFSDLEDDFDEDFAEDTARADTQSSSEVKDDKTSEMSADKSANIPAHSMKSPKQGLSGGWLGFLFNSAVWVAVAGLGFASLKALGVAPQGLWQPSAMLAWENYLAPLQNPANLLVLVFVAVFVITVVVGRLAVKTVNQAEQRGQEAEAMLAKVTALRLENESAWQGPDFKTHGPAATFVSETLGAWRLQAARQRHLTGLEGELHRLEKALSDDSRADLNGRFDSPAVGALADEMLRYFDDRKKMTDQVQELRDQSQEGATSILNILRDSRCWQQSSHHNVELQAAGMKRLAARLGEMARDAEQANSNDDSRLAMEALKTEFEKMNADSKLPEVLEKGNKLAFQMAMEVARLGPRGERLMPMTESLEELNAEMREVVESEFGTVVKEVATKISDLEEKLPYAEENNWYDDMRAYVPGAELMAKNLADINASYTHQAERLTFIGQNLGDSFGAAFKADDLSASNTDSPPAGVLALESLTPFFEQGTAGDANSIHQPADVDPFAVTPPAKVNDRPGDSAFTSSTDNSSDDIFNTGSQAPLPDLGLESSMPKTSETVSAVPAAEPEEQVYDLNEFGAVASTDEVADEVHDLNDFGAQPIVDEEPVHDLNDFGATRLDVSVEDEVFDLNTFGAVPLT